MKPDLGTMFVPTSEYGCGVHKREKGKPCIYLHLFTRTGDVIHPLAVEPGRDVT